jgi:ubiquinone/menaquinone biosynthesis C-methylase UbiE
LTFLIFRERSIGKKKKAISMSASPKPYRWLAEYYDTVFMFHQTWSDAARHQILEPLFCGVETACDLACGSGTTALNLARRGTRTYAVDLSPGMCQLARKRSRAAGLRLIVSRQNMRSFRLPERVDLVLCEYDALNHVPQKSSLQGSA